MQLEQYFRFPKFYEKSVKESYSKNFDQALQYGKIEISFDQKFKFWHNQSSFLLSVQKLYQPQNLTNMFKSWDTFMSDFKTLLNSQNSKAAEYPSIKINFFAKVYLSKKFISNENEHFALKTINGIFRLLERLIDSNTDINEIEKILKKVLILPLLFLQTEKQNRADFHFILDEISRYDIVSKFQPDFTKYFKSKTPRGFEIAFIYLFEKIKRDIDAKNLPFNPVQVMESGRNWRLTDIGKLLFPPCCEDILKYFESFRNPATKNRKTLLSSLEGLRSKLLELIKVINPRPGDVQYRNIRHYYCFILTTSSILNTHPMLRSIEKLFRSLDDAIFLGQNPEPIIESFAKSKLLPLISEK
jgi:hypothetical protein